MKYKFEQFKVEIENPTVTIDLNTIKDKAIDRLLSVDIILETADATFGLLAQDMPYIETWNDTDIADMVNNWLINFEVTENE